MNQSAHDLVLANRGLVYTVVRRLCERFGTPARRHEEDLVQAGFVGLVRAARRYRPERGAFTSYATVAIRRRVADELHTSTVVRPPAVSRTAGYPAHLRALALRTRQAEGLPAGEDGQVFLAEPEAPDHPAQEAIDVLRRGLACLSAWEREVVTLHWGLGNGPVLTLEAIARRRGSTRQAAHTAERKALRKLRSVLRAAGLMPAGRALCRSRR